MELLHVKLINPLLHQHATCLVILVRHTLRVGREKAALMVDAAHQRGVRALNLSQYYRGRDVVGLCVHTPQLNSVWGRQLIPSPEMGSLI